MATVRSILVFLRLTSFDIPFSLEILVRANMQARAHFACSVSYMKGLNCVLSRSSTVHIKNQICYPCRNRDLSNGERSAIQLSRCLSCFFTRCSRQSCVTTDLHFPKRQQSTCQYMSWKEPRDVGMIRSLDPVPHVFVWQLPPPPHLYSFPLCPKTSVPFRCTFTFRPGKKMLSWLHCARYAGPCACVLP